MVDITNVVIFNSLATLFILFWMYRNSILTRNYNEKMFQEFYQENRNITQYINDRMEKMEMEINRRIDDTNQNALHETNDLYRRLDDLQEYTENLYQKNVDGMNSRIPL